MRARRIFLSAVLAFLFPLPRPLRAYAVFTHEELIDLAWDDAIRPLLLKKFPRTTPLELERAHGYAYGGCVIQDMGYYPFGKALFSDLTHYVRSGDFVAALFHHARNVNEYAFAIGALSHYIGDAIGHAEAVNRATAIAFPKLEKRYGRSVSFEDDPASHVRTEFGFDVAQIAWRRFPPKDYRAHLGFRVTGGVLDRAFFETYGLKVRSILGPQRSAVSTYRFAVRSLIPEFARASTILARGHLPREIDDPARREFLARISRSEYARRWAGHYHRFGIGAYVLAGFLRVLPKIGPLKVLATKVPSAETEDLYLKSTSSTEAYFRRRLAELSEGSARDLVLANRDLDTGERVRPGGYKLTDRTYAKLLQKLAVHPGQPVPAGLREDILAYYSDPKAPISTKRNRKQWSRVVDELEMLRKADPVP